ncbi:hypothetical protein ACN4EG_22205 [Alkalinema pantanalense CENA528]
MANYTDQLNRSLKVKVDRTFLQRTIARITEYSIEQLEAMQAQVNSADR